MDDPSAISQLIQKKFKDIFQVDSANQMDQNHHATQIDLVLRELNLPSISESDSLGLLTPITDQEIRVAIFDIANVKSPGLDGVPSGFFKYYWELIGPSVILAVRRFFTTGFILKDWNKTLLVLVPKSSTPEEVSHYRPISLCNVMYKCIAKCMVHRMKHLLPSLID